MEGMGREKGGKVKKRKSRREGVREEGNEGAVLRAEGQKAYIVLNGT